MGSTRYAGRYDGSGVDDSHPGPTTIDALFTGSGTVIADPVSFPWSLVDDDHWRQPVLVDLRRCTEDDLTALRPVLPVLTPDDRVVATTEQRSSLRRELPLPDQSFLNDLPANPETLLDDLAQRKVRRALLREALGPVLRDELWAAVGIEARRPLTVVEFGSDDGWTEALLPKPHTLQRIDDPTTAAAEAAAIVVLHGRSVSATSVSAARRALTPGGLLVFVFDTDAVRGVDLLAPAAIVELVNESTGHHHVVEHVWVLSDLPGRPTTGGLLAVRPLGGAHEPEASIT